ncbi:MAG: hypothetical protein HQL56_12555, partial [Magnetococcales bacterium]|nr:hypothetical protein [Magnetococcales bacterium]
MRDDSPLQTHDHRTSPYERPTSPWQCGRAAEGRPCAAGPDRHGHCGGCQPCQPLKEGERWICQRPASQGGPCAEGPDIRGRCGLATPPCTPVRPLRRRRRRLAIGFFLGLLGLLLIGLGRDSTPTWVVPGIKSSSHVSVTRCQTCHPAHALGLIGWIKAAFSTYTAGGFSQSCLACHPLGHDALAPHGVAGYRLKSAPAGEKPVPVPDQLACNACHREHQGPMASLSRLNDARCQTCHSRRFRAFSADHADFAGYPDFRPPAIRFDHGSHHRKHFQEPRLAAKVPSGCPVCHDPRQPGTHPRGASFATQCAACHEDALRGLDRAGLRGIPMLRVPGLDLNTLRRANAAIGQWPEWAVDPPTPLTLLLARAKSPAELPAVDAMSLEGQSPETLRAVVDWVWAFKEGLLALSEEGQPLWAELLVRDHAPSADARSLAALIGGLSPGTVRSAVKEWFPDLAAEVARHRAGEKVALKVTGSGPVVAKAAPPVKASDTLLDGDDDLLSDTPSAPVDKPAAAPVVAGEAGWVGFGGWYRDEFQLLYRPSGHADALLRAWIERGFSQTDRPEFKAFYAALTADKAVGGCTRCHTLGLNATVKPAHALWTAAERPAVGLSTRRFSHTVHLRALPE